MSWLYASLALLMFMATRVLLFPQRPARMLIPRKQPGRRESTEDRPQVSRSCPAPSVAEA
jgi:hypothetical protein